MRTAATQPSILWAATGARLSDTAAIVIKEVIRGRPDIVNEHLVSSLGMG
jgi:hypothetical protein